MPDRPATYGGARAVSGNRIGAQRKSFAALGGGIMASGSHNKLGTARNTSYNGPRDKMQGLNSDMLANLNKENKRHDSNRPQKKQNFDEIENAINVRASRGEL